jgi:hypothetical protein
MASTGTNLILHLLNPVATTTTTTTTTNLSTNNNNDNNGNNNNLESQMVAQLTGERRKLHTVERHLSILIGKPSRPDNQKIRIISLFFENRLHWQFEVRLLLLTVCTDV